MSDVMAFLALTFALSWACFLGAAHFTPADGSFTSGLSGAIYLLGVFAPALVAVAMTARTGGRRAVAALLHRMIEAPREARWYVFALTYAAGARLTAALLYRVASGAWPAFTDTPWYLMLAAIPLSTPAQSGEEVGWRGYALPRLAARFGLGPASIVLGVVWGMWHVPFFYIAGVDKTGQSLPVYVAGVTALSVAMAWLYWRTNGSLLISMLMHAAVNNTIDIVPARNVGAVHVWTLHATPIMWLTVVVLWAIASGCLVQMRDRRTGLFQSANK